MNMFKNIAAYYNQTETFDEHKNMCKDFEVYPTIIPHQKRVIAVGDIHGDMKLAINFLKAAKSPNDLFISNTMLPLGRLFIVFGCMHCQNNSWLKCPPALFLIFTEYVEILDKIVSKEISFCTFSANTASLRFFA